MRNDDLTGRVIGAAMEIHRHLGPGLLESAYEHALAHELRAGGISFEQQKPLPMQYKGTHLDCGFRIDLLVEGAVVVEVKAVAHLLPIHEAQVQTYLRLTDCRVGLLLNFNCVRLRDDMKRLVWRYPDPPRPPRSPR